MTELEFKSLATEGYNRIPLIAEAFADLETPLTLYLKLAQSQNAGKNTFLLESVVGGERFGRYSFIGLPATTCCAQRQAHRSRQERRGHRDRRRQSAGLHRRVPARFKVAIRPGMPRFCGGLAGYFGYDAVRYIEKRWKTAPARHAGPARHPAAADRRTGRHRQPVRQAVPDRLRRPTQPEAFSRGRQRLRDLRAMLRRPADAPVTTGSVRTEDPRIRQGRLSEGRGPRQGIRDGRRPDAGADRPAPEEAYVDSPLSCTARCVR
jgi:anthranilate synthase component 1